MCAQQSRLKSTHIVQTYRRTRGFLFFIDRQSAVRHDDGNGPRLCCSAGAYRRTVPSVSSAFDIRYTTLSRYILDYKISSVR